MASIGSEARVGTTLAGRYRLERILNEGARAVVYAGVHEATQRPVAVKIIPLEGERRRCSSRLLSQARTAARLSGVGHVEMYDVDVSEDGGSLVVVMELLEGETLSDLLARRGRLLLSEAMAIAVPVLDALVDAHQIGIVHGDLSPKKIFLARELGRTRPKVLDLGLVWPPRPTSSPLYAAPESLTGDQCDARADVWSIGAMLYRAITGHHPFGLTEDEDPDFIRRRVLGTRPLPRRYASLEVHPSIARAIDRALQHDLELRWQTATDLRAALADVVPHEMWAPAPGGYGGSPAASPHAMAAPGAASPPTGHFGAIPTVEVRPAIPRSLAPYALAGGACFAVIAIGSVAIVRACDPHPSVAAASTEAAPGPQFGHRHDPAPDGGAER